MGVKGTHNPHRPLSPLSRSRRTLIRAYHVSGFFPDDIVMRDDPAMRVDVTIELQWPCEIGLLPGEKNSVALYCEAVRTIAMTRKESTKRKGRRENRKFYLDTCRASCSEQRARDGKILTEQRLSGKPRCCEEDLPVNFQQSSCDSCCLSGPGSSCV